jgi:acyl carrier protein
MTITATSDDQTLMQWLADILANVDDIYLRKKLTECNPSDQLTALGLDSLGRVNLFYAIIDELGVDEEETQVATWANLADVLGFIRSLRPNH